MTEVGSELMALEQQLDDDYAALATADCKVACRALESMVRAADRICALEPGPRCSRAQEKVADAKRRVREKCPSCAAAAAQPPPAMTPTKPTTEPEAGSIDEDRAEMAEPADAPPPADAHGACAPCTVGQHHDSDGAIAALLLAAALAVTRRKRRRR